MVHTFNFEDNYYIYDTGSGGLHSCDKLTQEVIKKINGQNYNLEGVSENVIKEIESDIEELKNKGLLYAKEIEAAPLKSEFAKALCLHICHDCNLRCKYCFADEGAYKGNREFMSEEVAFKAIDFLIKNSGDRKILEIDFFGGEPLMNFEVVKNTVLYAKTESEKVSKKFLFTITTNGMLLKGEIADFLNREMDNVVLSLDGRKEVHDNVRVTANNKGSYDLVIENIKNFVKNRGNKSYYVRGTFTAKNLDFSKDVMFINDNGFDIISLEPVVLPETSDLYIGKDKTEQINKEYEVLAKEYLKRKKEGKPFNFFHFNIDLEGGPCINKRVNACGAGNEYFSITPNGNIYPCHQFADNPKLCMGTVFEGIINQDTRNIFKNSSLFTKEKCKDCFAKFHCSGGCSANNYNFNGDIDKPYEMTCEMMKKRIECAMHILAESKKDI
jgi:uncharacterized protein